MRRTRGGGKTGTARILLQMPAQMKGELRAISEQERKPVAWLIRDAIAQTIEKRRRPRRNWKDDPLYKLRGFIKKDAGPPDLSEHVDDFLYGPRPHKF